MTDKPGNPRPRVLSGMRPTGKLHLGNYVGALKNWVNLQHTHDCFFFIADWHALTTDYDDTSRLAGNTVEVVLDYLAAGLDPEKCTIFVQSHVKQHAELHLLFSMMTPLGWLERVPTYKEQQANMPDKDLHMYGFLGYPLLMAADILLYRANFVPVGEDQDVHVELTREVARRFNSVFCKRGHSTTEGALIEPQTLLTPSPKLLGMDKRKMSKSYGNFILLSEETPQVDQKIKKSVTDRPKLTDRGSPDRCPVGNLHQIFSSKEQLAYITEGCTQATIGCVECKALASPGVNTHLDPIRERRRTLSQQPERLQEVIEQGARTAFIEAEKTMQMVRQAVGVLDSASFKRVLPKIKPSEKSEIPTEPVLCLPLHELQGLEPTERGNRRRDVWLRQMRKRYTLNDVGHRTFATLKKRRVGVPDEAETLAVPTAGERSGSHWFFSIGDRTYNHLALLCHLQSGDIVDFIIPRDRIEGWKNFTREGKEVKFEVRQEGDRFLLNGGNGQPQDITSFRSNYSALE